MMQTHNLDNSVRSAISAASDAERYASAMLTATKDPTETGYTPPTAGGGFTPGTYQAPGGLQILGLPGMGGQQQMMPDGKGGMTIVGGDGVPHHYTAEQLAGTGNANPAPQYVDQKRYEGAIAVDVNEVRANPALRAQKDAAIDASKVLSPQQKADAHARIAAAIAGHAHAQVRRPHVPVTPADNSRAARQARAQAAFNSMMGAIGHTILPQVQRGPTVQYGPAGQATLVPPGP
jgi:hypothetical protein